MKAAATHVPAATRAPTAVLVPAAAHAPAVTRAPAAALVPAAAHAPAVTRAPAAALVPAAARVTCRVAALLAAAALASSNAALAHTGTGLAGGFVPGFMHPLSGFDHLLAMVCVGLWGAFLGRPLINVLPVVFPAMMVGGAVLGMFGVPLPPVEIGVALSVLVLGTCVALAIRTPVWSATALVAAFAVFHGYAHGRELPSAADPIGYSAGFVLATGLLHVLGIAIGILRDRPGGAVAIRGLGAVIGASGGWFLCRAITS